MSDFLFPIIEIVLGVILLFAGGEFFIQGAILLSLILFSSLGSFLYFSQFSKVFLVKVLTVDLYDLFIKRFLSAICILFFADLLLATEGT